MFATDERLTEPFGEPRRVAPTMGEVELLFGSEVHRLSQGDMARYRSETPHAFRNASSVGIALVIGAAIPPW